MLVFTIHVSQFIRYPSQNSKAKKKKRKKGVKMAKEEIKLSLTNDMIMFIENSMKLLIIR